MDIPHHLNASVQVKLYVAGPMTNYPNLNRSAFTHATTALANAEYEVYNPAPFEQEGWTQAQYVRWALREMLACDGVATLHGWQESWGASIEVRTAQSVLMPVLPTNLWIVR